MSSLSQATPITLTDEERAELEGLARATKTEHRTRMKAQIVLMAADGAPTRAIGRALGCTTGTVSKWRVRYAKDRLAGFSEAGNRGAEAKYGIETDRRILASQHGAAQGLRQLDRAAHRQGARRRSRSICLAFPACPQD